MYENDVHQVANRIVSISQPYVRPIVRGKVSKQTDKNGDAKTADEPQKKSKQRIPDEQRAEIARLYEQKIMKSSEIAKQYEISLRTVQRIAKEAQEARA